ncbi:prefoldin, alpha subunit [Ancylostoma caninum]|uniref:Prefoldin, alpha subunit n=1 Tax=Ancylostoma caninum TaxID=29170 RepID=A0A368H965_ANCCA|nr:prefoldin, alpha subunit [Ancylostoma caninum]
MATAAILNEERMKAYSTAAEQTFSRINKLLDAKHQELKEYDSLIQKLEELPRKRTHSIMCPVGSVGFLPASIVHTNEVLVGLGDGYFVDTTCYDAVQILERRKKVVEKNIADLHEHENLLKNYSKYAKELFERQRNSDEVEIREEYDEVKEAELRKKRKSRIVTPRPVTKTMADINAEAELMKRLEELEQQELRNGELDPSFDDTVEEDDEAPPTLDKILEKLDDEDTKTVMSILSSDKSALSSMEVKERQSPSVASGVSTVQERLRPAKSTVQDASPAPLPKAPKSTAKDELPPKTNAISAAEPVRADESTGYFRGDDLMRMLAEQQEEYEENPQSYQPPPGISTEAYQRVLRAVEEMNDEDSDDVDEDDRILEESEEEGSEDGAGSELDSDDLSEPENGRRVNIGPFTVQNLGPNATVIGSGGTDGQQEVTERTDISRAVVAKPVMEMGSGAGDDAEGAGLGAEESKKKNPRKKKSVVFAENLEDATLIDKNAPPSDVRAEPSTSTSDTRTASILRNAGEKTPTDENLLAKMNTNEEPHKVILPGSRAAFTGVVQEKNVEVLETGAVQPTVSGDSTKRQSLFKMKRLKNHV